MLDSGLVLWDTESPTLTILDARGGEAREVELEPVFSVVTASGKLYVLMRWKLAVPSSRGEALEVFYLPVPLVECFSPEPPLFFGVREWLIEAEPVAPFIQLVRVQVEPVEAQPVLHFELSVSRPGSLKPLEAQVAVSLGGAVEKATLREGVGRVTLTPQPGLQKLTITVEEAVKVGCFTVQRAVEVVREIEVPAVEPVQHAVGDLLGGKVVLREKIGAGGFGVVYRGRDIVTDRLVAVKIPHSYLTPSDTQSQLVTEALKAAEISKRLNRERKTAVEIYEAGVYELRNLSGAGKGRVVAIIMEYCEGGSLRSLLTSGKLRKPLEALSKIAEKVALLSREGIVHGDLKPENILFTSWGEPLLADFYTATILSKFENLKKYAKIVFTEGYAPPELIERGEVNTKTDVYSLAALTVEVLAGAVPAAGTIPAKLLEQASLKPELVQVLARALSPDPSKRPPAEELATLIAKTK